MPPAPFEHPAGAKPRRPSMPDFDGYRAACVNALLERRRSRSCAPSWRGCGADERAGPDAPR